MSATSIYNYETVAAGQTTQTLGATGGKGDYLSRVIIVPATTSPGVVTVIDGSTTVIAFAGGASSLTELKPITVEVGTVSVNGAWKITTGTNVSVMAIGDFL